MSELRDRRENLFNKLPENSVAVIYSGVSKITSEDEFYPFCVNKNFYYLTNIEQEHSVLVLLKGISSKKVYLFVDEYNELKEKWTGKRLTFDQASEISNVQNVYSMNTLDNMLNLMLTDKDNQYGKIESLFIDLTPEIKIGNRYSTLDLQKDMQAKYPALQIENVYPLIRDLRMVKSSYEIEQIIKDIDVTNQGILNNLKNMRAGMYEYELADMFEYYGKSHDRHSLAFSTIVASGKNATCLHYPTQNEKIGPNDLVLFDLGYRENQYCADISRTYPVSGTYVGKQKDIYQAVLNTNKAVIAYIRDGLTLKDLQDYTVEFLKNECIRLELMDKDDDIRKYYYHNISHHLGLDTHDISIRERPLENGNVIAVEPGLYFANYGIGVRIEDDVAIENGVALVLSNVVKKEIKDIEQLFKSKGR